MATRNRIDASRVYDTEQVLFAVLNNTVAFLKCPLTDEEMLRVWHYRFPAEILSALNLLHDHRFFDNTAHSESNVTFIVPDFQGPNGAPLAIRWQLSDHHTSYGQRFTDLPRHSEYKIGQLKHGNKMFRPFLQHEVRAALGVERGAELFEWAIAAATIAARHAEARATIREVLRMLSTAGQLRRMVPELVNYLPHHLQESIADQKRASPFPELWAQYPKDRIERMTAALAEGHLFAGMSKQRATGNTFSWAQFAPANWEGVQA